MKKYSVYDAFLVFSLILAVATNNSRYSLIILAIASIMELIDLCKSYCKETHRLNGTGKEN